MTKGSISKTAFQEIAFENFNYSVYSISPRFNFSSINNNEVKPLIWGQYRYKRKVLKSNNLFSSIRFWGMGPNVQIGPFVTFSLI